MPVQYHVDKAWLRLQPILHNWFGMELEPAGSPPPHSTPPRDGSSTPPLRSQSAQRLYRLSQNGSGVRLDRLGASLGACSSVESIGEPAGAQVGPPCPCLS